MLSIITRIMKILSIIFYIILIINIIAKWKIFVKTGRKGWKSLIPIYNLYQFLKISDAKRWFIITYFCVKAFKICIVFIDSNILKISWMLAVLFINYYFWYNMAKKFNLRKTILAGILGIIFSNTLYIYFGFSKKCIYNLEEESIKQDNDYYGINF